MCPVPGFRAYRSLEVQGLGFGGFGGSGLQQFYGHGCSRISLVVCSVNSKRRNRAQQEAMWKHDPMYVFLVVVRAAGH